MLGVMVNKMILVDMSSTSIARFNLINLMILCYLDRISAIAALRFAFKEKINDIRI